MYTVYKHTTPSGKVYVGITKQKPEQRWDNGNGHKKNEHFYRAILKYGWENIEHEIVENGLTKQQACDLEIELIAKYDATDPRNGYNNSIGGECGSLGVHPSAETRRKISESLKHAYLNPELRRKIGESHKGYQPSDETRRKLSESLKGANNPMYGKRQSDETRRKLSEALKGVNNPFYGKRHSDEALQKMSESHKGKTAKAVICVETGTLYSSVAEAAKYVGVASPTISNVLHSRRKTSGGYHWKYAD